MHPQAPLLVRQFRIERYSQGSRQQLIDTVAAEEPLQLRLQYWVKEARKTTPLALTMRTPGADRELAAGYLLTEGIIEHPSQIEAVRSIGTEPSNEIVVELAREVDVDTWMLARNGPLNASCGICGKRTIEALTAHSRPLANTDLKLSPALVEGLPDLLRAHQDGFGQTGGLHAAALVNAQGNIESAFEDIGRHNALDKLIGHALLNGIFPLSNAIVFLSSRSSLELVQKTMMAGASVLATVGGPSSLAIETALNYGITLIGFIRAGRFNVYSGNWRIQA